jgi:excisionase family DNA binding protein
MSDLLTVGEAARYLRVDAVMFSQWVAEGRYDVPITRVGPFLRFRKDYLDRWLRSRTVVRRTVGMAA